MGIFHLYERDIFDKNGLFAENRHYIWIVVIGVCLLKRKIPL